MAMGNGWMGDASAMLNFLRVVGADQDEKGCFMVGGSISSFMGAGDEYVVGEDAYYLAGGQQRPLAAGLRSTSQGIGVTVIA